MKFLRHIARIVLGVALGAAGASHLGSNRTEFLAQVPTWLPIEPDFVVVASGVVEIVLGLGLIFVKRYRQQFGVLTALFFIAIFPGNIAQLSCFKKSHQPSPAPMASKHRANFPRRVIF
jgi:uncharacterized membrane protein